MFNEEVDSEDDDPMVVENDEVSSYHDGSPFIPPKAKKKEDNAKFNTFMANLSNLSINIPLLEAIQDISGYVSL